jgi:GTP diphosphokinase / guanosine-3',5'-bis(diphosphate) 3'-diphosphatase
VLRDGGTRSRGELLADIGLGKRLPAVVARQLVRHAEGTRDEPRASGSVTIRGTEGMAVQLASCCRPIPGDAIIGSIKKGQGLVVHVSECGVIARSRRKEPDQWIDVEWDSRTTRLFQAAINLTVENQRGVLAKVASEIAEAGSNIDSISMDEDRALFTTMHLVLEVANRQHLARVMRSLRRLPATKRISRMKE